MAPGADISAVLAYPTHANFELSRVISHTQHSAAVKRLLQVTRGQIADGTRIQRWPIDLSSVAQGPAAYPNARQQGRSDAHDHAEWGTLCQIRIDAPLDRQRLSVIALGNHASGPARLWRHMGTIKAPKTQMASAGCGTALCRACILCKRSRQCPCILRIVAAQQQTLCTNTVQRGLSRVSEKFAAELP